MSEDEATFLKTMAERLLQAAMTCADPATRDQVTMCANACLDRIGRKDANGGAHVDRRTANSDVERTN